MYSHGCSIIVGICLHLILLATRIEAHCYDPSPAFAIPKFRTYNESAILKKAFENITASLKDLVSKSKFDTSSFSVQITTSEETLWELHHTAREKNLTRPDVNEVNNDSVYRMASVTKAITTLAIIQQHVAGNLSLDDSIDQYIEDFQGSHGGKIPWKDITLRTVASQLSGIPREFAQADVINIYDDPTTLGLPPVSKEGVPQCDVYYGFERPCTGKDLLSNLVKKEPLWPPKQKSSYSNVNFNLLGLVIENVTGLTYTDYVEKNIFRPLGMTRSYLDKPNDSVAVIPKGGSYWDIEEGIQRPTGGLYSSSSDMSKFVRYCLAHYNGLSPQFNWFQPFSYTATLSTFFGMPWEIFRTNSILRSTSRPTTFVTKGGAVPAYFSIISMLAEYDIGISILTASPTDTLKEKILETLTSPLINALEDVAQSDLADRYTGVYAAKDLNSTLVLAHSHSKSLYVKSFVSNSTDILTTWAPLLESFTKGDPFRIQLVPTLLYRDEVNHKGELWKGVIVSEVQDGNLIWDDFCITNDDFAYYAGLPIFEFVLWGGENGIGVVEEVELSSFKITLGRAKCEEAEGCIAENSEEDEATGDMRGMKPQIEQLPLGKMF